MKNIKLSDFKREEFIAENVLLVLPVMFYWVSAVMSATLGVDYFYDVFFVQLKSDLPGKLLFALIIIVFPIGAFVLSLINYRQKKEDWKKRYIAVAAIMIVAGILAFK